MKPLSYDAFLDPITADLPRLTATLKAWSDINSGSSNLDGLNRMLAELQSHFANLGGEMEILDLPPLKAVNGKGEIIERPHGRALRIRKRPDAPIRVLLGGHYDTVFPADHSFQTAVQTDANTLNGPGVADLKGGLLVLHRALVVLEASPVAKNIGWEILINPDEEIGSFGSTPLFVEAAKRNHVGLIFEPSLPDGTIVGKRGGTGNFTLVVRGKAAHAGREHHLGRSAIRALSEMIVKLESLNGALPGITVNVGHIEGGGPLNVVPDLAIARFNVRNADQDAANAFLTTLDALAEEFNRRDGITVEKYGFFNRAPKPLTQDIERLFDAYNACAKADGYELKLGSSGGVCDGNTLAGAGLPNLDTLGVRGGAIHSDKEYVLLDSLVERSRLTARYLLKLANGEITP